MNKSINTDSPKKHSVILDVALKMMSGKKICRTEVIHFSDMESAFIWELSDKKNVVLMKHGKQFVGAKKRNETFDDLVSKLRSLAQHEHTVQ